MFREKRMEGEREGEKHQCVVASQAPPPLRAWPATQARTLTGNRTSDPPVHKPVLNPLSHTSQGEFIVILLFIVLIIFFLDKCL